MDNGEVYTKLKDAVIASGCSVKQALSALDRLKNELAELTMQTTQASAPLMKFELDLRGRARRTTQARESGTRTVVKKSGNIYKLASDADIDVDRALAKLDMPFVVEPKEDGSITIYNARGEGPLCLTSKEAQALAAIIKNQGQ